MPGSEIIICGERHDVGHPVVTFEDEAGFSAYVPHRTDDISQIHAFDPAPGLEGRVTRYRARRAMGTDHQLYRLRQVVRQVVVHLDGCKDAKMCYQVLHNQRGLSIHFMVDNDGTIYQSLDLLHCAFHAGGVNEISIGIELQNRGDAARNPNYYTEGRPTVTCRIHGYQFLCYDFTEQQYTAMTHLCRVLTRALDIPLTSPQQAGAPHRGTIDNARGFRGFLGHFHIKRAKWDPGPWDFARLFRSIGAGVAFPLTTPTPDAPRQNLKELSIRYYDSSEKDAQAHFPLGPLGQSRLWHGGVHLPSQLDTPVRAALRGRIVAARLGPPCPVGSCNFVLLRHEYALGSGSWTFFSLYYHLAWATEVPDVEASIPWLARTRGEPWRDTLELGQVVLLSHDVEAAEVIGMVGEAGPPGYREDQIHFAIFSEREMGEQLDPGYWEVIESQGTSRLCKDRRVLGYIDRPVGGRPADGRVSRRELRNFFSFQARRSDLRRMVVRHRSEWTPGNWAAELDKAPDFADLPPAQRRRLIDQQIRPTLWWTDEVGRHAGLPADGMVYSYHPIGFLTWFDELTRKQEKVRSAGIESADRWEGKLPPEHLTLDRESGMDMTDEEDFYSGEKGKELTLEDLVNGYPDT